MEEVSLTSGYLVFNNKSACHLDADCLSSIFFSSSAAAFLPPFLHSFLPSFLHSLLGCFLSGGGCDGDLQRWLGECCAPSLIGAGASLDRVW